MMPAVQYRFDPETGSVDPTGYWALVEEEATQCTLTPTATPTTGINPLLLLLIPLGLVGLVATTEKRGEK